MTKIDAAKILATIKAGYPQAYKDTTKEDTNTAVNLWATMFADDDYAAVGQALKECIAVCKFPPTIAEVREKMASQKRGYCMTAYEAWALVKHALGNGYYGYQAEFEKLPEMVQRAVGNAYILRDWASIDVGELDTVVHSQFVRSYSALTMRENDFARLPGDLQRIMRPAPSFDVAEAERMMLENSGGKS